MLNAVLGLVGIEPIGWLVDPEYVMIAFVIMSLWGVGSSMIVYLSGLQSIPNDLYEAALIDGAGGWHRFRRITLPLLRPVLLVAVLLNVIYVFNSFPIIWVLTEGGPANQTHIIVTYLYQRAITQRVFGPGYAMAVLTFAVLLLFSVLYTRFYAREGIEAQ